jgi:hypothetical protein
MSKLDPLSGRGALTGLQVLTPAGFRLGPTLFSALLWGGAGFDLPRQQELNVGAIRLI